MFEDHWMMMQQSACLTKKAALRGGLFKYRVMKHHPKA